MRSKLQYVNLLLLVFCGLYSVVNSAAQPFDKSRSEAVPTTDSLRSTGVKSDERPSTESNNDSASGYFASGRLNQTKGKLDEALADYARAIELKPDYAAAFGNRGVVRRSKGDLVGAIADFDKVVALNQNDALAYYQRGTTKHTSGDIDGAISDFDKAIELNSGDVAFFYRRGLAKWGKVDVEGALADFDRTIALKPDHANAHVSRGHARKATGLLEQSTGDFEKAISLIKGNAEYLRFYLYVTQRQRGMGASSQAFARDVAQWSEGWTKTIGLYLSGVLSEAEFIRMAGEGDVKTLRKHQCEALYFVGMMKLAEGDTAMAVKSLKECMATRGAESFLVDCARAELKRLAVVR